MATEPFFTVVIPVYQRADVLANALGSVLVQTCQDFEVIVVDDGSTDDPGSVVRTLDDPRIRFIRQENRGGGDARNRGLDEARGRFVALLDSDDVFLPHHLERMRELLEGTTNTLGYAPVIADRGGGSRVLKPFRGLAPGEHMGHYLLCDRGFIPTMTMVVEANIGRKVRFPEDLRCAEDTDFAIRLYLEGCKFVMSEEPGAIWNDAFDPRRSSAGGRRNLAMIPWIESLRGKIPDKAYYGCYGWAIAKSVAMTQPLRAFFLYLSALARGCYSIPVAGIVFLQIFLPDTAYRRLSEVGIAWRGHAWDASRRAAASIL